MHLNMQTSLWKSSIRELKGDVTRDDFSATQRYNIVVTLFRMAAILSQHFNPVLRLKASLRIVPCNITFKQRQQRQIGFRVKTHLR